MHDCGLDLDSVGTDDIVDFVAARRASGLAAASVARQIAAMRMLHRHLVTEGERADDPTAELEGVRVPAGIPKPLREAEVDALLDAVVGHDPVARRDRALLELLYGTGARISEVCGLSMGEIDFDGHLVRLFGKGSKERIVPFGRRAAEALDEWFAPGGRVVLMPREWRRRDDAQAVFLNSRGGRLHAAGGLGGDQEVRPAGRPDPPASTSRRTCCATAAPPTCSTTAPTCGWCRRCSATPRSRPPRCTPR